MNIVNKLGNTLLVVTVLLASETTIGSSLGESVVGTYKGEITGSSSIIYSVVTEFSLDSNGRIIGAYTWKEVGGSSSGSLDNCTENMEIRQVICIWRDRLGAGAAEMNFSEDHKSFSGGWNDKGSSRQYPWNGKQ